MFTGIIQHTGIVRSLTALSYGMRLAFETSDHSEYRRGESVAVNGVCLTVLPESAGLLTADVSPETMARTTLGELKAGTAVNLERAMTVGDRIGGHIVQGHVDATGTLLSKDRQGEFAVYRWSFPSAFSRLLISKGSIAVDGVSLTVVEPDSESFGATLIPETLSRTNLEASVPGSRVNLEFDTIAKYVSSLVAPYLASTARQ